MKQRATLTEYVDSNFSNHVFVLSKSKSFSFYGFDVHHDYVPQKCMERHRTARTSAYSFELTWRPGYLILTGDLGEITLVQKYSMGTFEEALKWAADADYSYLMGKTNVKKVYDPEATYRYLIDAANQEAVSEIAGDLQWVKSIGRHVRRNGLLHEYRRYRHDYAEGVAAFNEAKVAFSLKQSCDEPVLEDYLPTPVVPAVVRHVKRQVLPLKKTDVSAVVEANWEFNGYRLWIAYWEALMAAGYYDPDLNQDDPDEHPTYVLKAKNRNSLKQEIRELCDDQNAICGFLQDAGYDDYYGSYTYPEQSKMQIDAIQHGCKMLLNALTETQTDSVLAGQKT